MKAIHVGTTKKSRIYYLLESKDQSTGAVVTANQPVIYVDFFAYVSKKGSIERVMDSEFHKFFWTGHTGSLSERWEQTFIQRVTSPREMALSGIEILTEFKEKKKPTRANQLNERANRAVEYKALMGAGLNEKAFAGRGVRRIGRGMGNAASGGVRGFRRGVRFDPEAEDADGDGFVQEGTQYARRATSSGMRSTTSPGVRSLAAGGVQPFLPPKPPPMPGTSSGRVTTSSQKYADYLNNEWAQQHVALPWPQVTAELWDGIPLQTQKDLIKRLTDEYEMSMAKINVAISGNDAKEILTANEAREAALRALIGGREIRTIKDAKELAFRVHPQFEHGESRFDLLERDENDLLNEYERTILVTALTLLQANPLFKTHPVHLREKSTKDQGALGYEQWQPGTDWGLSTLGGAIVEKVKKAVARMGGSWSESGMTRKPFTPQERAALLAAPFINDELIDTLELAREIPIGLTGMEGETTKEVVRRSAIARIGEMFTLKQNRPGRSRVTYRPQADDHYVNLVESAIRGELPALTAESPHTSGRYATADALFVTLLAHADKFPTEEKHRLMRKAAVMAAAAVIVHELGGHSTHSVNTMQWALDKVGPNPATGEDDSRIKHLLTSALTRITEKIKDHSLLDRMVLDSRTISEYAKPIESKGLSGLIEGIFGIAYDDTILRKPGGTPVSLFAPGEDWEEEFRARGIHGILRSGTAIQKQRLKAWLSQPVMDTRGNPYTANAGLSKYFEELKEVALQEWGIDLTIGAGEQLTVAHILFGTNPHERGFHALHGSDKTNRSTFKSHKKGGFAFLGTARTETDRRISPHPSGGKMRFKVRKSQHEVTGQHLLEDFEVGPGDTGHGPNGQGQIVSLSKATFVTIPDLTLLRERGLPAFTTNRVMKDGRIVTTAVTPEDTAPLLDALARVTHVFPHLDDAEFDPAGKIDAVLDQLEDITFDHVEEIEIGLTGVTLDEFLETRSSEQQQTFREKFIMDFINDLFLQSIGTSSEAGLLGRVLTDTTESFQGALDAVVRHDPVGASRINNLVEKLAQAAEWSDDLSDKRIRVLTELADSLGFDEYAAYGGAVTGFDIIDFLTGNTRHEMIAELITAMTLGLDFPVYNGRERQALSPDQIDALIALFKLWQPDGVPKIRSKGKLVPINE
jgi:hypothetical protein